MISTPEQYDHTKELITAFEEKLDWLDKNHLDEDPRVRKLEMDAYASFLESLRREITEYETTYHPDLVGSERR